MSSYEESLKKGKADAMLCTGHEPKLQTFLHPNTVVQVVRERSLIKNARTIATAASSFREERDKRVFEEEMAKQLLITNHMSRSAYEWYELLSPADKALPMAQHPYYGGPTIIGLFVDAFDIHTESEHYRQQLDSMRDEKLPKKMDVSAVTSRIMRAQRIFQVIDTLPYMTYVSAAMKPLWESNGSSNSLVDKIVDKIHTITHTVNEWPLFHRAALKLINSHTTWTRQMGHSSDESDEDDSDIDRKSKSKRKHNKKRVRWDNSPFPRKTKHSFRKASSVKSKGSISDDESSETNEEHDSNSSSEESNVPKRKHKRKRGTPDYVLQQEKAIKGVTSTLNSLKQTVNALTKKSSELPSPSPAPSSHSLESLMSTVNSTLHMVNQVLSPRASQGTNAYSGLKHHQRTNRRQGQSKVNSIQNDTVPSGNRYKYNPQGPEPWKRWLLPCGKCGRWGLHLAAKCQNAPCPSYSITNDPRNIIPIEDYPRNRQTALQRCKSEKRIHGVNSKWNCGPNDRPDDSELSL